MGFEHCSLCDSETGRAGRADDSLYLETPSGAEVGPLCEECHDSLRRDDLEDEAKRLEGVDFENGWLKNCIEAYRSGGEGNHEVGKCGSLCPWCEISQLQSEAAAGRRRLVLIQRSYIAFGKLAHEDGDTHEEMRSCLQDELFNSGVEEGASLRPAAKDAKMTPEEAEAQRRSFAYGNVNLANPNVTRQDIDDAADRLAKSTRPAAKDGGGA